ncbi:hypothetical protein B0H13DRAFT_1873216 [Mycena leptocephala]|nr:hypothetical protein B0H13DRAFT_1873216 [Mycena leptocephala]
MAPKVVKHCLDLLHLTFLSSLHLLLVKARLKAGVRALSRLLASSPPKFVVLFSVDALPNQGFKVGKIKTKRTVKSVAPAAEKKKHKKRRKETYNSYIYKVLKQVHPDTGISNRAMAILKA